MHRLPTAIFLAANIIYPEAEIILGAMAKKVDNSSFNLVAAENIESEVEWVYKRALAESRNQLPSAILFGKHKDLQKFVKTLIFQLGLPGAPDVIRNDYDSLNSYLRGKKIKMMYFGGAQGGQLAVASSSKTVLLMTTNQ